MLPNRFSLVLALALAASPLARAQVDAPTSPAASAPPNAGLVELTTPAAVKELCLVTRPRSRVLFEGDEVEQGKAREAFKAQRGDAMKRLYKVRVPARGFSLKGWDTKTETLSIDLTKPLRALYGALNVSIPSDAQLPFLMRAEPAAQAAAAMKAGTAALDAYFELDDAAGAPCSGSVAMEVFTLSARPVAFELRDGTGQLLGRSESALADAHREILGGYSGVPTVSLGPVQTDDNLSPAFVAGRLKGIIEPVRRCYEARLLEAPSSSGVAVVGVTVAPSGQVEAVNFIADALGDQVLRDCVDGSIRKLRFEGVRGLFRVPVELKLAPRK